MRAWVAFGAIFLVVFGGLLALRNWLDAPPPSLPEGPDGPAIAADYGSDYEALSQRLAQVPGILPAEPVDQPSCTVPAPLDPPLAYSDVVYGEPDEPDNTEIVTERTLTDPLLEDDIDDHVVYPSDLLGLVRASTHPPDPEPGGRVPHPDLDSELSSDQIRARLENGLATRYLVVLRPVSYVPYGDTDFGFAEGSVDLDGFVVDLHNLTLLCSFDVQEETTLVTAVVGDMAPSYQMQLYEDLLGLATGRIREQLTALTGGTWL